MDQVLAREHQPSRHSPSLGRPLVAPALSLAVAFFAAGLVGCGDGEGDTSFVDVFLTEWAIEAEVASVPAGDVRFTTTNGGSIGHDLVVIKTALPPDELPTREDGSVDEDSVEVVGRVPTVEPGEFERATLSLGPGQYALVCNIIDAQDGDSRSHYQLGMHTAFTVSQAEE